MRLVRAFVVVADTGSVSEAAQRLGYSQPAVTRQIKELERVTGCQLFERGGLPLHLTDAGRARLPVAKALVALSDSWISLAPDSEEDY